MIHALIIDEIGGLHGIRDLGLLISITERPKISFGGREIYDTVFKKAAVYFESLVQYHVFVDGNKRTALGASARFLYENGFEFTAVNKAVEQFVMKIAGKEVGIEEIVAWLEKNSKKS